MVWSKWRCTFSPLSLFSLPFSDNLFLAECPRQFIGVALPRHCAKPYSIPPLLHHFIWMCDWCSMCVFVSHSVSFVYICKGCVLHAFLSVKPRVWVEHLLLWESLAGLPVFHSDWVNCYVMRSSSMDAADLPVSFSVCTCVWMGVSYPSAVHLLSIIF